MKALPKLSALFERSASLYKAFENKAWNRAKVENSMHYFNVLFKTPYKVDKSSIFHIEQFKIVKYLLRLALQDVTISSLRAN